MATFSLSRLRFQSCFILLLSITFIVSVTIFVFGIRPKSSKVWFSNFTKLITFQTAKNHTLINMNCLTRRDQTVNQQTSNAKHTAVTTVNRHNTTDTLSMKSMTTVLVKEASSICYHEAYPHNYRFIIDEPHKCEQENPFLVLMVPVAPHELEARNAIRRTWGNESVVQNKTITVIFSLGLPGIKAEKQQEELSLESQQYHDLVQSDFMDSYLNLTIKTMLIMDWLASHCPQASYAMKIDSDMFLNLENLMNFLLRPDTPKENYMTGKVMWNIPVIRDKNSKWYVPKELYAEDYYPTYPLGMGYVFSNDLSEKIVKVSKEIKPFNIEDAYVGACLERIGLSPSDPPNPSQFKDYFSGKYNREEFASVITTILNSPQQLITFWQDLKGPPEGLGGKRLKTDNIWDIFGI
ncbi:beta-1,3-galactosyltransferase 1-like isoform X2 [Colossoma macropomum]|nr:beta-1,3-galactosyltransferase 1-like isoform X2 [Colossoma macropomum]XP_036417010.1 beta-1,3-galactosyltransferase 1-like isoform X2 [Colossoma macropomum]XP_036417011.1 beta-1,3-galactosyltransferase 1-like isoform X2 [Colossoma macropomum]